VLLRWLVTIQNKVELHQSKFVVQGIGEKRGGRNKSQLAEYNLGKKENGKGRELLGPISRMVDLGCPK